MQEVQNWVLSGVVLLLIGVAGWGGRALVARVLDTLKDILAELRKLNETIIRHDERIVQLQEQQNKHEERLTKLENKQQ